MSDPSTNCQYCGFPLSPSAKFCEACGQPVYRPSQAPTILASKPQTPMPQAYEDIQKSPEPNEPPAEPTVSYSNSATPPEPPRQGDIPDYPVVKPAPPQKKGRTGLIIVLVLGGGFLCLLAMILVGFFVVNGISKNIKPTLESLTFPEKIESSGLVGTFEPIPLDATSQPDTGGAVEVTVEAIQTSGSPEKPSVLTGPAEGQMARDAIIIDDFETDVLNWGTISDDTSVHQYEDGAYTIAVLKPEYIAWSEVPVDWYPVYTEFDVWVPRGNDGGSYGVLCYYQSDNDYYYVEIDPSEDAYSIGHYLDGEYNSLTIEDWPYTDAINIGTSVNRMYVACELDKITLFLNDEFVDQIVLPADVQPGSMEIFASTWDDMPTGGYKVFFDNFTAWKPVE